MTHLLIGYGIMIDDYTWDSLPIDWREDILSSYESNHDTKKGRWFIGHTFSSMNIKMDERSQYWQEGFVEVVKNYPTEDELKAVWPNPWYPEPVYFIIGENYK